LAEIESSEQTIEHTQAAITKTLGDIDAYKKKMEPLLRMERAAFERWEARERAKDQDKTVAEAKGETKIEGKRMDSSLVSWEERLLHVERAKKEFIESIFPPEELQGLLDQLNLHRDQVMRLEKSIAELRQENIDFTAQRDALIERTRQLEATLALLQNDKANEINREEEVKTLLECIEAEHRECLEHISRLEVRIAQHSKNIKDVWDKLATDLGMSESDDWRLYAAEPLRECLMIEKKVKVDELADARCYDIEVKEEKPVFQEVKPDELAAARRYDLDEEVMFVLQEVRPDEVAEEITLVQQELQLQEQVKEEDK
jgi:hypothetical protein